MVGSAALMRVSSATRPFWRGTLKSTRTSTFFPDGSTSRIVRLRSPANYRVPAVAVASRAEAAAGARSLEATNCVMSARRQA